MKRIAIIGSGPGGLSAGMLLAYEGYQVDIFEKNHILVVEILNLL